jgi:hypothetical protein
MIQCATKCCTCTCDQLFYSRLTSDKQINVPFEADFRQTNQCSKAFCSLIYRYSFSAHSTGKESLFSINTCMSVGEVDNVFKLLIRAPLMAGAL